MTLTEKRDELLALLRSFQSVAVAFSAGVDSSVVAKAAQLALGEQALAVTANSASLADGELQQAREIAEQIGIRHRTIATAEQARPAYVRNDPDRCYHCKSELYIQLEELAEQLGVQVIVNGANADDSGDYRPGMQAASEHAVRSPLAELKINKAEVRQLAQQWQLPVWDKPAMPCLASRVAYGVPVTPGRMKRIDLAEQFLRQQGMAEVRVRLHEGELARIEVPLQSIGRLAEPSVRDRLVDRFKELGFKYVTLDLAGFRSGSLNDVIDPRELLRLTPG